VAAVEARLEHLLASRCLIDHLPDEILACIGHFVVLGGPGDRSSDAAFKLAAVSKRWRTVFLEEGSRLWGYLRFDAASSRGLSKLIAYLRKGDILGLRVDLWGAAGDEMLLTLIQVMEGRTSRLESLDASVGGTSLDWNLYWPLLDHPNYPSKLHTLFIRGSPESPPVHLFGLHRPSVIFTSLTSLTLFFIALDPESSLFPLLQLIPNLKDLDVSQCSDGRLLIPSIDGTDHLHPFPRNPFNQ